MNSVHRQLLVALAFLVSFATAAAERPNILFIMTDDHAAHAISCYGSNRNETPNLDRLAKEGVKFERCFVTNSICTPSRATLLTGKYSHKNGTPVFNRFDGSQPVVSRMLQSAGYYTAVIGKWHLGSDPTGFDRWLIFPGQGAYRNPVLYDQTGPHKFEGYATDIVTDLTIDALANRPKDKPFFLLCHHKAPHREWTPDAANRDKFSGKEIAEPATLRDDYATRTDALRENQQTIARDLTKRDVKLEPPAGITGDDLLKWKYQRYMQDYLACVQSVDDNVGRLLDWLEKNDLSKNTVVIYTSDNGFFLGEHGMYDKRFMYEESLRIPFLVRWPEGALAGKTVDAIAINTDFAPTFLDLAGQPVPADMQGRSLVPLLRGPKPVGWRESMYYRYYHDPGHHNTRAHLGVRTVTHKLIHYWKKDQWEMFDLTNDPHELRNLYADPAQQETIGELKSELARLKEELGDQDEFASILPRDGVDAAEPWKNEGK